MFKESACCVRNYMFGKCFFFCCCLYLALIKSSANVNFVLPKSTAKFVLAQKACQVI